jgi:hypothetical protein
MIALLTILGSLVGALVAWNTLLTPAGRSKAAQILFNIYAGVIDNIAPLFTLLGKELQPAEQTIVSAFQTYGGPIALDLNAPLAALARTTLTATTAAIATLPLSTPDNAIAGAAEAFAGAFGNGLSSAAVAALFESIFPEKLNTLNGLAPMIAKMAGFDEVAASVLEPLYKNAFGRSLEYLYRSQFKPELPSEDDAVLWHARGLLTDAQLQTLFNFSGLKSEYEAPFIASAYHAIQPRALASLLIDAPFPTAEVQSALTFFGLRPADASFMLGALEANSTRTVRLQYLSAAVRSTELGTMTPAELTDVLNDLNFSQDAQAWVQLTVATRKLEQLAELYRRSISEGYGYGTITDAQYVPMLEAIGIGDADAEAHYAVDSIKKIGKAAVAAERAAVKLATSQERAAQKAAVASFRTGTIDAAALTAALLAAQMDPTVAGFTLLIEQQRQLGPMVNIYGQLLTHGAAAALRLKVSALGKQTTAGLQTAAQALAILADNGVPAHIASILVAGWTATKTPAADVGALNPLT